MWCIELSKLTTFKEDLSDDEHLTVGVHENTSSLYIRHHFEHYKTFSGQHDLLWLQVDSLNLALSRLPLELLEKRGNRSPVLEKELGNCYIEKLWIICLLEADFNWLLKHFFVHQMMQRMWWWVMLPIKQIAAQGKSAIDGVMRKQLFLWCRVNATLTNTDIANCCLALQAMLVPSIWYVWIHKLLNQQNK